MHGKDIGAGGERDRDRHLATRRRICRLELDHFDNLLVRHELHERAVVRVGLRVRAGLQTFFALAVVMLNSFLSVKP